MTTVPVTSSLLRKIGGAEGIRTPDLLTASQARSQLRHSPAMRLLILGS
jgi:hypothetical protein